MIFSISYVTCVPAYEQHISLIHNPSLHRRGSMADFAFPELHPQVAIVGRVIYQ